MKVTTTKLYTRDEVVKIADKASTRAIEYMQDKVISEIEDPGTRIALTIITAKTATVLGRKLKKLLDKAEGKK